MLADLRRKEVSLNDADRRRRAAERLGEIEQRSSAAKDARAIAQRNKAIADQREREQRAAGKAAKREREGVQEPAGPAGIARTKDRRAKPLRNQPAEPKSLDTESNAQAYGQRLNEAQQRKAKAGKKLTERTKPAARSLPLPP
ncbi:MAG: hypothetical protein ABIT82_05020 [Ramlibacter sp.]